MFLPKYTAVILLSGVFALCAADAMVYETYFQEPPDDWYATTFQFGSTGAVIDYYGIMSFDANLCTGTGIPMTCNIFIPDGADSVRIGINQSLTVSGGEYPNMDFRIYLATIDHGSEVVWEVEVDYQNPQTSQSGTLYFSPEWIGAGDFMGFYFRADVIPDDWGSSVYWGISHITVYVYGNDLEFQQNTWGSIKATMWE